MRYFLRFYKIVKYLSPYKIHEIFKKDNDKLGQIFFRFFIVYRNYFHGFLGIQCLKKIPISPSSRKTFSWNLIFIPYYIILLSLKLIFCKILVFIFTDERRNHQQFLQLTFLDIVCGFSNNNLRYRDYNVLQWVMRVTLDRSRTRVLFPTTRWQHLTDSPAP